ncbi:MAG: phosphotransferase [Lentisphaerae bacterium]|nr:phosphotransferase [Lentisphaerota bacterium]
MEYPAFRPVYCSAGGDQGHDATDSVGPEHGKQPARTGDVFPVTYSILSSDRLAKEVQSVYPLSSPVTCDPLHLGLNDTYLIRTGDESYVLRVSRAGWRSPEDVLYEVDLLTHLHSRGVPVARPVAGRNGQFMRLLSAPEGIRPAVLFTYAPGKRPTEAAPYVRLLGQTIARLHVAGEDFTSRHARFPLDLAYFLDSPLQSLRPLFAHRRGDWNDMVAVVEEVRARGQQIPLTALQWGHSLEARARR